uniref:Uncharacterized protein n=1 Tax=Rhizophora mucronata TaxID=61149 RepID=A0A2P2NJE8_RHIMU
MNEMKSPQRSEKSKVKTELGVKWDRNPTRSERHRRDWYITRGE